MAESTTIRADQIEGLPDLIREQVRAALRQETQPFLQDMEEIRRSPAGILIRLEEQIRALEEKMEQRFIAIDQRFAGLKAEMEQRFAGLKAEMEQRFIAVDQRFTSIDQRFQEVDKRLNLLQWTMGLVLIIQVLILGKLFFPP